MTNSDPSDQFFEDSRSMIGMLLGLSAIVLLLGWWRSDDSFLDFFIWDLGWLGLVVVLFLSVYSGVMASSTQETWQQEHGWSPRAIGNAVLFLVSTAGLAWTVWKFVT